MKFSALVALALGAATTFAAPIGLEARQGTCSDVYVFFVRGTTETPAPLGDRIAPFFRDALVKLVPEKSVEFTGVPYAAGLIGYLIGGDPEGAKTMANMVTTTVRQCSNAKIFMSGYSQGAQVTHLAARQLSDEDLDRVTGVVTFGDPYKDTALPGTLEQRRKTFCRNGDLICERVHLPLPPHFEYHNDAEEAARWVADRV
uniref:cutinase n=1 Tax=Coprinopsis cinerea TaxID=5346 RepID=B9U444_COPCI|nr:cutinase [Coprinopsis cinerea]